VQAAILLGLGHVMFRADKEDTEVLNAKLDVLLEQAGIDGKAIEQQVSQQS
jgi:hypothetical protein